MSASATATLAPTSLAELTEAVRASDRVLAVGRQTKPALSTVEALKLSTLALSKITEYDPNEFTFSALAGTPLKDLIAALAERGQYLPFDPLLVDAGATIGGTVAAGLSGPGRFRFGGIRDFILGVRFVDGLGRLLRMGGKVVKNAAGFDVPKFLVGSMGRFGVIGEVSFKVFPRPPCSLTLKLKPNGIAEAAAMMSELARSRYEPDAIDLLPGKNELCVRLAGPAAALKDIAAQIVNKWPGETLSLANEFALWSGLREFTWADAAGSLIKIPITLAVLASFHEKLERIDGARAHISAAGNLAFVSLPALTPTAKLDGVLTELGLTGMTLRGSSPALIGKGSNTDIAKRVKTALDPNGKFPSLEGC